MPAKVTWMMDA